MASGNHSTATIGLDEAATQLATAFAELATHPETAYEVVHDDTSVAVILHPATFEHLLDVAQASLDLDEAESALATEPLQDFAEYHAQRMARRAQSSG